MVFFRAFLNSVTPTAPPVVVERQTSGTASPPGAVPHSLDHFAGLDHGGSPNLEEHPATHEELYTAGCLYEACGGHVGGVAADAAQANDAARNLRALTRTPGRSAAVLRQVAREARAQAIHDRLKEDR